MSLSQSARRAGLALTALATALALTAGPAGAAPPKPVVVQLGDSYSSGNGAGGYTDPTCFRSPANYGAPVAAELSADYVNVACGGAVVADILEPRALGGVINRTGTYTVKLDKKSMVAEWLAQAEKNALCGVPTQPDYYYSYTVTGEVVVVGGQATATAACQLHARPQIDGVTHKTSKVFLTMGGNDIGFTSIVVSCILQRDPVACPATLENARATAPTMATDLEGALRAVRDRSKGRAEIYLLGYPYLLNTASYTIPEGAADGYDYAAELAALQAEGDRLQAQVVAHLGGASAGFHFVDVKPAWDQLAHGLDPHVTPDNSASWLWPLFGTPTIAEWVHPKPAGWSATAGALSAALS